MRRLASLGPRLRLLDSAISLTGGTARNASSRRRRRTSPAGLRSGKSLVAKAHDLLDLGVVVGVGEREVADPAPVGTDRRADADGSTSALIAADASTAGMNASRGVECDEYVRSNAATASTPSTSPTSVTHTTSRSVGESAAGQLLGLAEALGDRRGACSRVAR